MVEIGTGDAVRNSVLDLDEAVGRQLVAAPITSRCATGPEDYDAPLGRRRSCRSTHVCRLVRGAVARARRYSSAATLPAAVSDVTFGPLGWPSIHGGRISSSSPKSRQ